MTLLIVVDMQNDFVTGALGTAEAQAIVPRVNAKIAAADAVVYTLDTHGEDYLATQEGKRLPVPHCIRGHLSTILHRIFHEYPYFCR